MAVLRTDWAAIKEAVRLHVETLAECPAYFRDDNVPQHDHSQPFALIAFTALEDRGVKTVNYERLVVSGLGFAVPCVSRYVRATVDVSVRAMDQIPGQQAEEILSHAQLRAEIPELSALPTTVAVNSCGPITAVPFEQDGFGWSQASSTWILSVRAEYQNTDVRVETVESVVGAPDGPLVSTTHFAHVTLSGA